MTSSLDHVDAALRSGPAPVDHAEADDCDEKARSGVCYLACARLGEDDCGQNNDAEAREEQAECPADFPHCLFLACTLIPLEYYEAVFYI